MAKKKLRSIVVDGAAFHWVFRPSYHLATKEYHCHDVFWAYAEDNPASPLCIVFLTWENPIVGGPLRTGLPVFPDDPNTGGVNLHQPKWAAAMIRAGLKKGWQANTRSSPFIIENGIEILAELNYEAD